MHTINALILLFLSTITTFASANGPYIASGSGSLPHYPIPTGTGILPHPPYPTGTGTGVSPPLTSINPGGPIESAATCPFPVTVTVTTDVTVTVTVPPGGTGTVGPTASVSGGLKRRMEGRGALEMRGLGEEMGRKERRGFWG